jgi:hypothetical protein
LLLPVLLRLAIDLFSVWMVDIEIRDLDKLLSYRLNLSFEVEIWSFTFH